MRPLVAIIASSIAVALAACGQPSSAGNFKGEEETVATVVEDLQRDGQRHRADEICDKLLTAELEASVKAGKASCASEMKKALEDADTFELEVTDVTITGTKATARVKGDDEGNGVLRTMELVKGDDGWRISSFGS